MYRLAALVIVSILALPALAEERTFRLYLAPEITESGLDRHILPRFALKTGRRAELVEAGQPADIRLVTPPQPDARPVMARQGAVFAVSQSGENPAATRFAAWLLSDIGQHTIASFTPADGDPFTPAPQVVTKVETTFDGDAVLGRKMAERHCARCHRVSPQDRASIGSTPSFMALRALPDWDERMMTYYVRNPHPSFMRVEGISPDFTDANPPAIVPVVLSQHEMEAVQAYVSAMTPANLGAPVASN